MGNKIAILIDNKSIELIVSDRSKKLELPSNVLKNQEIIDTRKYSGLITNFFNKNNLVDEEVIILLLQEVLYEKKIPVTTPQQEEKEILNFLNTIPFENNKISFLKIPEDGTETIIATNKDLYTYLLDVCSEMKLKVEAVFPIKALGEIDKNAVNWKVIPQRLDKLENSSPFNFLNEPQEYISQGGFKKYLIISLIILLIAGLIIVGIYLLRLRENQKNTKQPTGIATSNITPVPETTSSGTLVAKNQLSIEVLNGTGTPGLASDIRDQLLKLGYTIIETGNFEGTSSADTRISFTNDVSSDNQNEIINLLKKTFSNVISSESSQLNFNAIIITGQKK